MSAVLRMDELEISCRSYVLSVTESLLDSSGSGGGVGSEEGKEIMSKEEMEGMVELLRFERAVIDLCRHILKYAALAREDLGDGKQPPPAAAMKDGEKDATNTKNTDPPNAMATEDAEMDAETTEPPKVTEEVAVVPRTSPYLAYHLTDSTLVHKLPFFLLEDTVNTLPKPFV